MKSDDIAFWSGDAGARWVTFARQLDRAFAPLSAAGLAAANVRPGNAVLDVGCGSGATLLALADAVGADGRVLGVDVSGSLLALAEQRARERGLANVQCIRADAARHAFDEAAYDVVFSRFGVMFFDDPVGAFANLRRALRPAGRLVFICWRELAANPWFSVPAEAVRPYAPAQPRPDPEAPGPLSFADPERVGRILEHAGFESVQFAAFDAQLSLGPCASASELVREIGPVARLYAEADESGRAAAKLALDRCLQAHETDGDVRLGGGVWIVNARVAVSPSRSA